MYAIIYWVETDAGIQIIPYRAEFNGGLTTFSTLEQAAKCALLIEKELQVDARVISIDSVHE